MRQHYSNTRRGRRKRATFSPFFAQVRDDIRQALAETRECELAELAAEFERRGLSRAEWRQALDGLLRSGEADLYRSYPGGAYRVARSLRLQEVLP